MKLLNYSDLKICTFCVFLEIDVQYSLDVAVRFETKNMWNT